MRSVIKRDIKNYLKNPVFWIGVILVLSATYGTLAPYLAIHYVEPDEKIETTVKVASDGEIMDGSVPSDPKQRRQEWEKLIHQSLQDDLNLAQADQVIEKMKSMDIHEACKYLEVNYKYYGAIYSYEDTEFRKGSPEEINQYMQEKLEEHTFSYYFSKKYTDFAGLYMGFFAVITLAFLFVQDTKSSTYELLHTKPIAPWNYVIGKIFSGFLLMLGVLVLLTLIFMTLCAVTARKSGFTMNPLDFIENIICYVLPNMMMICCVYATVATICKTPLPAVPALILYMTYSNMLEKIDGIYHVKPLSIMVRFPGRFFDTALPYRIHFNQIFLVFASMLLMLLVGYVWKRRRMY